MRRRYLHNAGRAEAAKASVEHGKAENLYSILSQISLVVNVTILVTLCENFRYLNQVKYNWTMLVICLVEIEM